MHVHGPNLNLDYELSAVAAAAKAAERREADETRKKLLSASASLTEPEGEECVVTLQGREDGDEQQAPQQDSGDPASDPESPAGDATEEAPFSDYA